MPSIKKAKHWVLGGYSGQGGHAKGKNAEANRELEKSQTHLTFKCAEEFHGSKYLGKG